MPAGRGNQASTDQVTVSLDYSLDAGADLDDGGDSQPDRSDGADAATGSGTGLEAATSRFLQLRLAWSSVLDWAPVLTQIWADYAVLDNAPPRRRMGSEGGLPRRPGQAGRGGRSRAAGGN